MGVPLSASDCALPEEKVHHAAALHPILHLQHASLHAPDLGLRQVAAVHVNRNVTVRSIHSESVSQSVHRKVLADGICDA